MPYVYQPEYTVAIPPSAIRLTIRNIPSARWTGRGGRTITATICPGNPARARVKSAKWYAVYTDEHGTERQKPGFTDRAATEALLAKLVQQSARIAAGLLPPEASRPRQSLGQLLEKWEAHLRREGDAEHADRQRNRAAAIVAGIGAVRPADLTPSRVAKWIAEQRTSRRYFGATTAFHYAGAIKAFTRWLCRVEKYEPVDHLSAMERQKDETDPRRVRRVLSPDELAALIEATRKQTVHVRGLTPIERAVLYCTAASTGLRARELGRLTVESFDLAAVPPTVTIEAAAAKNKRRDVLYIPDSLLPDLRRLLADRKAGQPVWPSREKTKQGMWWRTAAKMLRADLAAAGIPYVDATGRVFDFHAMRSQFITDLDRAGVSLARAQKLARHSTPMLTARFYTRPEAAELAAEVNKLGGRSLMAALRVKDAESIGNRLELPRDLDPKESKQGPKKPRKTPSARGGT